MHKDDLSKLFGSLPPGKREELIRAANAFMATRDGQAALRALENDPSLQKKLKDAQANGISKLTKADRERLLRALGQGIKHQAGKETWHE